MSLIERRKRSPIELDMTPMIDVVFQLLIFLLVATRFTKPETMVDLPAGPASSETQLQPDRKALTIAITPQGDLVIDFREVTLDQIPEVITTHLASGNLSRVEIRGDKVAHFGVFVKLLEATRASGIQSVAIVKQVEPDPPATQ